MTLPSPRPGLDLACPGPDPGGPLGQLYAEAPDQVRGGKVIEITVSEMGRMEEAKRQYLEGKG